MGVMRKLMAVLVMVGTLAGCGTSGSASKAAPAESTTTEMSTTTTRPTTTTEATTTTTAPPTPEDLFLAAIDDAGLRTSPDPLDSSKMRTYTDEDLIRNARSICETTSTGLPANPGSGFPGRTPAEYLIENEEVLEGTPNGERVKLAIRFICPENQVHLDDALSGNPTQTPPMSTFPDGAYTVGDEVAPGTYVASDVHSCYWERVDGDGRTIDNDFVTAAPTVRVTISESDAGFTSERCGPWSREP